MDEFVNSKLTEWGLVNYVPIFKDNEIDREVLECLDKNLIDTIFLNKVGPKAKFLMKWEAWRKQNLLQNSEFFPRTTEFNTNGIQFSFVDPSQFVNLSYDNKGLPFLGLDDVEGFASREIADLRNPNPLNDSEEPPIFTAPPQPLFKLQKVIPASTKNAKDQKNSDGVDIHTLTQSITSTQPESLSSLSKTKTVSTGEKDTTLKSSIRSDKSLLPSVLETHNRNTCGDQQPISIKKNYLNGKVNGLLVNKFYEEHHYLTEGERNHLTDCVIESEIVKDPAHKISSSKFVELSEAIEHEFPTENRNTYYIPFSINKVTKKKVFAKGKLFDKYHSFREKLIKNNVIKKKPRDKGKNNITHRNNEISTTIQSSEESVEISFPESTEFIDNSYVNSTNTNDSDTIATSTNKVDQISNFTFNDFQEVLHYDVLVLLLTLYNAPSVPRSYIQLTVDSTQSFMRNWLRMLQSKVVNRLQATGDTPESIAEISAMFEILENPFKNLETEYQCFKTLEDSGHLILPEAYVIGSRFLRVVSKDGHVSMNPTEVKGKFFPLRKIFKKVFEQPGVYDAVMDYKDKLESETDVVSNFIQGRLWKEKMKNQKGKNVLPLFLSFDDYETGNTLGSHRGVQKIGAAYIFIPCFPPEFLSSLRSIFIALLFYSFDRKEFGNSAVFYKLIEELKFLQEFGNEINLPQGKKILYFQLGLILGDNLGIHELLGFVTSFNANFSCRFCKMERSSRDCSCVANTSLSRNRQNYEKDLAENKPEKTGIKENCVCNEIVPYHATENFIVDFMHDGPEGFLEFDMVEILKYCILKAKFFTIDDLNNIIVSFDFGPYCTNIPPPISLDHIKSDKISMSAAEMLTFVRHFGLLVGHFVPLNDPVWNFYLHLRKTTDLLTAPVLQRTCSSLLRTLIEEHHRMFMKLFKRKVKPKMHIFTHYPDIMEESGPVIHLWSMRSESKHRQSKLTAVASNCKINVCATVGIKHQLQLAFDFVTNSLFSDTLQIGPTSNVPTYTLSIERDVFQQDVVSVANWLSYSGNRYKRGSVICIGQSEDDENGLPQFGVIEYVIYCDNEVFFLYEELEIIKFNNHFYAYECSVNVSDVLKTIKLHDLPNTFPTHIIRENGKNFLLLHRYL